MRRDLPAYRPQGTAASSASTPAPVRVGGNIRPPRKVHHVSPVYPATMREAGLEGVVPMEAIIAADGKVQSVRVLTAGFTPTSRRPPWMPSGSGSSSRRC